MSFFPTKLPARDPLLDSLQYLHSQSLVPLAKEAILSAVFGDSSPLFDNTKPSLDTYFQYFESTCRASLQRWSKYDILSLKLHHVTTLCSLILQHKSRGEMERYLAQEWGGVEEDNGYSAGEGIMLAGAERDCMIISSEIIDLALRLSVLAPVWNIFVSEGEGSLMWVDGNVQRTFLRHFKGLQTVSSNGSEGGVKGEVKVTELEGDFTARNIEHVARMKVVWTDNLLDHLLVRDEGYRTLRIFHHVGFLKFQEESNIYPPNFIVETLHTLCLLLPATEQEVRDWSVAQIVRHQLDPLIAQLPPIPDERKYIENFIFWRDRLVHLKECYDTMMPRRTRAMKKLRKNLSRLNI